MFINDKDPISWSLVSLYSTENIMNRNIYTGLGSYETVQLSGPYGCYTSLLYYNQRSVADRAVEDCVQTLILEERVNAEAHQASSE